MISATSRTTIDACRTLLVWIVSISLGWESYVCVSLKFRLTLNDGAGTGPGTDGVGAIPTLRRRPSLSLPLPPSLPPLSWAHRFDPYQIIGFTVLVFGTFMYNEVFHLSFIPFLRPPPASDEYEPLLNKEESEPLWNPVAGSTAGNVQTGSQAA